jgi:hypothetical protein
LTNYVAKLQKFYLLGTQLLADFTGTTAFSMSARLIDRKNGQKLADILVDIIG